MITYREITMQQLADHMLEIDVSEHGDVVYYWVNTEIMPIAETWDRPRWKNDSWRESSWLVVEKLPGVKAWGAFEDERMVGVIVFRPRLTLDTAQLAALFVSQEYRRSGIAVHLFNLLRQQAKAEGYTRLYVSATPSESAINFYRSRGFIPTREVNPELYALEPDDIHMVMRLNTPEG